MSGLLTPEELEAELHRIGEARYHWNHPFHKAMKGGELTTSERSARAGLANRQVTIR